MTDTFAQRMVALEKRMLDRFGANGRLISNGDIYDHVSDRVLELADRTRTVRMTVGASETLDEKGVEVFRTVARLQVEPKRGDSIVFAGRTYEVGNVRALYEGDTITLYVAEVD